MNKVLGWLLAVVVLIGGGTGIYFWQQGQEERPVQQAVLPDATVIQQNAPKQQNKPTKIGAAIALTGYGAAFGEGERNAIYLLREKYPEVEFFIEDNKSNPKDGLQAVKKLIDIHNVDLVYCDLTTVANAVVEITKENSKILLAAVYLSSLLERSPYAIRNLPRGKDEAKIVIEAAIKSSIPPKNVALLGSNDEFGRSSIEDFKTISGQYNLNFVFEDLIPDNEQVISSLAGKVLSNEPDTIYIASLLPSLGVSIKELRSAGFEGNILTTDAFAYSYARAAAGDYASGTIYAHFPETDKYKSFSTMYEQKFGQPSSPVVVFLYDGLSLLLEFKSHNHQLTAENFMEKINGSTYDGLFGEVTIKNREIIYPQIAKIW